MNPLEVNKSNVANYKQNRPALIANDLAEYGVPTQDVMKILTARGVMKWFSVRRSMITLKDVWKIRITNIQSALRIAKLVGKINGETDRKQRRKVFVRRMWMKGYLAAMTQCREELRKLNHSTRWQFPDKDSGSLWWMD